MKISMAVAQEGARLAKPRLEYRGHTWPGVDERVPYEARQVEQLSGRVLSAQSTAGTTPARKPRAS